MALESFYGGKPGISPVIRASFKYIDTEDLAYQAKEGSTSNFDELGEREKALLKQVGITDGIFEWNDTTLAPFTMDVCFSDPEYRDVWYSELCIIDTENKLNPNNGKIFRRTLKRVETTIGAGDTLYAEYIGQIVGPSGGVPNISFGSVDAVRKQATGLLPTINTDPQNTANEINGWDYNYPTRIYENENDTTGQIIITTANPLNNNEEEGKTRENDYEDIATLESNVENNSIQIVPGKDGNDFHDNIRYTWCNVRRNLTNSDVDSAWFYLGFEIPYTSWDVTATNIPYWLNTTTVGNVVDIQKLNENDQDDHPFYHNLHFYIPRGTRGIGPEEFILVKDVNTDHPKKIDDNGVLVPVPLYPIDAISYNSTTDTYSLKEKNENNESTQVTDLPDSYWIAKWTLYNPQQKPFNGSATNSDFDTNINRGDSTEYPEIYLYLGEYKDIAAVRLEDTGELQIQYSSDTSQWLTLNTLKWITDINLDTNLDSDDYGEFTVIYNTYQKDDDNNIIYQKDDNNNIILDNNGNPIPLYEEFSKIIPLIKDIKVDTNRYEKDDEGHIKYDDNNEPIPNDNYGTISVEMSGQENPLVLESKLPFPEKINYNEGGKLQFYYTDPVDDPIIMEDWINDIVDVKTQWVDVRDSELEEHREICLFVKFRDPDFFPTKELDDIYPEKNNNTGYINFGPIGQNKASFEQVPFVFVRTQKEETILDPDLDNYGFPKYYFEKMIEDTETEGFVSDPLMMPWDSII